MTKRILFVDDDPNVLQGLRRMLHPMRREWDMAFADSGAAALALLCQAPFEVMVSDMHMPQMNGVQLLTRVKERYPHIVRIILSGYADHEMILGSVGPTHQFLTKPCDTETLKAAVTRACALRDLLANEALRRLVAGIQTLPSLPPLYLEVLEVARDPNGSLKQIGKIIEQDISMTAKILQLVNSAFFGLRRQISSPVHAVSLLGLDTVQALVLSARVFKGFDQAENPALCLDDLWQHSMAVGVVAKQIVKAEGGEQRLLNDALMAGLLHDVGKLVLATNLPERYREVLTLVQAQEMTGWEAEQAVLGATHAEVGAYLLGIWGLPDALVGALAFHHCPAAYSDCTFSLLTAVHVANALVQKTEAEDVPEGVTSVDLDYLVALGLSDRLAAWRADYETALSAGRQV